MTLINSVLDALPTYMMSLFPASVSAIKRIDTSRNNFFWQGNSDEKKFHLVKRDIMIRSKKEKGMSIGNLKAQNQSLMLKWLRRYASEEEPMLKKVI